MTDHLAVCSKVGRMLPSRRTVPDLSPRSPTMTSRLRRMGRRIRCATRPGDAISSLVFAHHFGRLAGSANLDERLGARFDRRPLRRHHLPGHSPLAITSFRGDEASQGNNAMPWSHGGHGSFAASPAPVPSTVWTKAVIYGAASTVDNDRRSEGRRQWPDTFLAAARRRTRGPAPTSVCSLKPSADHGGELHTRW